MDQLPLLGNLPARWERLELPNADVRLLRGFLAPVAADALLAELMRATQWRQDKITFYGTAHPVPRLTQWYGDAGLTYTWSGIRMEPQVWSSQLLNVKTLVEAAIPAFFNTVLLNYYRNGDDTVSWHSDDERELGSNPVIASLSLGAERDFLLKHTDSNRTTTLALPHGSLLVMAGTTQTHWRHSLPRRKGLTEPRINLTFRRIFQT